MLFFWFALFDFQLKVPIGRPCHSFFPDQNRRRTQVLPVLFLFVVSGDSRRHGRVSEAGRRPQLIRENIWHPQTQVETTNHPTPERGATDAFPRARHGSQLWRLGSSGHGPSLVPTGSVRRAYTNGLLQHRFNVGPGLGVSFRNPTPVPARRGQRGAAPSA